MTFSKTFAAIYDPFMYFLEKIFLKHRRARLISGLSGRILEVGVGTGVNFEHYRADIELTGIEPSPFMLARAKEKKNLSFAGNRITLHNTGMGYPEMETLIEPGSLDVVVVTLVLCTIPDPEQSVKSFLKWLKPGGRLIVLEHIRSHNHLHSVFQDLVNPYWKHAAEGCNLNRPTDKIIKESGFNLIREDRFKIGIPFYEAEFEKPLKLFS
jgi:SAM-dependent methyltransferase